MKIHIFASMKKVFVVDQMNREVEVPLLPKRIVSLVPSQTELLYELGLDAEVVGQTLFCIHPQAQHQQKPRIGGTKNFSIDKIKALNPDLIIGNKEENHREGIEQLEKLYPVWMSDICNLMEALDMIRKIGALVGRPEHAESLAGQIQQSFEQLQPLPKPKRAAYLIWRSPWMAAGKQTFIDDMLSRLGLENVFNQLDARYPEVSEALLKETQPECLLLSSEPYPFKEKHIEELQRICPKAHIMLVDGELFSWYGSRLKHSVAYFKDLLGKIEPQKNTFAG